MKISTFDNLPVVRNEIVTIIANYCVVHFDDVPILYYGSNKFGNKIIGSHLESFYEENTFFSLHTIVTDKEFNDFINKKISYSSLIRNSNTLYIVKKDFSDALLMAYEATIAAIPHEYMPTEHSFVPSFFSSNILSFIVSLRGKLADMNKAVSGEVSRIQNGFTDFLEGRVSTLKNFDLKAESILHPYSEGSFKINFELEIIQKNQDKDLFLNSVQIKEYISDYLKYISNDFSTDKDYFLNNQTDSSVAFKELEESFCKLYDQTATKKPENITDYLKEDIIKSASKIEKLTENVGGNFDSLSIMSRSEDTELPLAFIDKAFSESFRVDLEEIEIQTKGLTTDDEFKNYVIYIYHLNTDTRIGNALIKDSEDSETMSKPRIKIIGDNSLSETKYTKSLYLDTWITVRAKAKKVDGKFKSLEIEFENE